ncbi:MAG TPA: hypothetical protein VIG30_11275, partial [Ktedonobacterales bacterium]
GHSHHAGAGDQDLDEHWPADTHPDDYAHGDGDMCGNPYSESDSYADARSTHSDTMSVTGGDHHGYGVWWIATWPRANPMITKFWREAVAYWAA